MKDRVSGPLHYPTLPSHGIPPSSVMTIVLLVSINLPSSSPQSQHTARAAVLFAISENVLLSVALLLHSNKIATLPLLEELAFSCNGADIDNLRAPFDMSLWKALDARAHQLSGKSFRALNVDIFCPEGYLSNGIIRMISKSPSVTGILNAAPWKDGPLQASRYLH